MRTLFRNALAHASALSVAILVVSLAPFLPSWRLSQTIITGSAAIALLYAIFACFCSHTLHHRVLLLDAGLKERFDHAARDSICLFDERRSAATRDLRQISVDTVRTAKEVADLRRTLMIFGCAGILCAIAALGLQSYVMSGLPALATIMASAMLCEVSGLLLRCRARIGRDFPHPGPTAADFARLDKDIEAFERLHKELLMGGQMCTAARTCRAA